tara:strand:- start:1157 stop:1402 length:246 start_codon:yes stop_codon:yes gene_type:complete
MAFESRRWVIITLADYTDEQLEELVYYAIQTSVDSLRKSVDETKAILKYEGTQPSVFSGLQEYTHEEILNELQKEDWTIQE